jgi:hypothetical protein
MPRFLVHHRHEPRQCGSKDDALRQLPFYVAQRSTVTQVAEVEIP